MTENLNIEYHTKIHVTVALRKYQSPKEAAKHLGITSRTVHRYIHKYNIKWKNQESQ